MLTNWICGLNITYKFACVCVYIFVFVTGLRKLKLFTFKISRIPDSIKPPFLGVWVYLVFF